MLHDPPRDNAAEGVPNDDRPPRSDVGKHGNCIGAVALEVVPPRRMPTLEDAIRLRRERHLILREVDEEYEAVNLGALFPQSWLPVATTELGSDLCADTAAAGPAPLHTISKEVEVSLNHFESLSEFVELILYAFEQGLVEFHALAPDLLTFVWDELPFNMRRLATWP